MGTKGVPFGYLEFSCAFGGKSCPHICASPPSPTHPGSAPVRAPFCGF